MAETSQATTIEHDIVELEKKLQEKRAALGQEKNEKEVLHEVVGEKIKQQAPSYIPKLPTTQAQAPITTEPPSYLSQELKDKIQEIVELVFSKNLEEGIKEAVKTGNMAVVDAFHDILVDELYSKLIETRKLDRVE